MPVRVGYAHFAFTAALLSLVGLRSEGGTGKVSRDSLFENSRSLSIWRFRSVEIYVHTISRIYINCCRKNTADLTDCLVGYVLLRDYKTRLIAIARSDPDRCAGGVRTICEV